MTATTALAPMTRSQQRTFDELLVIGAQRPFAPTGLVEELTETIAAGTATTLARWTEPSLYLSKAQVYSVLRCEGGYKASRDVPYTGSLHKATAIGTVTHRAIQLAHTHSGRPVEEYVRHAVAGARSEDSFEEFWVGADMSLQSEVTMEAVSKVTAFLDSWPPLDPTWSPRFEERVQAKVGKLTLAGRVDLILGRPRPNGQQSMVISDWKSGALNDGHFDEAMFYALVATLRHGVPPFRSTVYSLASGTWTDPDVTAERLRVAAGQVVAAANSLVDVMTEARLPLLSAGRHCTYCPLKASCAAFAELHSSGG